MVVSPSASEAESGTGITTKYSIGGDGGTGKCDRRHRIRCRPAPHQHEGCRRTCLVAQSISGSGRNGGFSISGNIGGGIGPISAIWRRRWRRQRRQYREYRHRQSAGRHLADPWRSLLWHRCPEYRRRQRQRWRHHRQLAPGPAPYRRSSAATVAQAATAAWVNVYVDSDFTEGGKATASSAESIDGGGEHRGLSVSGGLGLRRPVPDHGRRRRRSASTAARSM